MRDAAARGALPSRSAPGPGRAVAFFLLVLAALALVMGINRTRNLAAANRLAAACIELRSSRDAYWARGSTGFEQLFRDDLDFVHEIVWSLGEEPCVQVQARLRAPLTIGWLETWQGEPWPAERMEHLRQVIGRAEERCPVLFTELFRPLAGTPEEAARLAVEGCASMMQALHQYEGLDRESLEPLTLTEWPARIEELAAGLRDP